MPSPIQLPPIPEAERTPLVEQLSALIEQLVQENRQQAEAIQQLRDEIAVLKGEKAKPKFKPSGMEEETDPDAKNPRDGDPGGAPSTQRPGSNKRRKTPQLRIHQDISVRPPPPLPPGSRFKGYRDCVVQDLKIEPHNRRSRRAVWQTPAGQGLCGELPKSLHGSHFGPGLRTFVWYQHPHCHVTQPLLHEPLREWGIDLSVGPLDALRSGHTEAFFVEKDHRVVTGLEVSRSITVDDSGARHPGQNGSVTQSGTEWFAGFSSTSSKHRINCLQLLHAGSIRYGLHEHALD